MRQEGAQVLYQGILLCLLRAVGRKLRRICVVLLQMRVRMLRVRRRQRRFVVGMFLRWSLMWVSGRALRQCRGREMFLLCKMYLERQRECLERFLECQLRVR